MRCHKCGEKLEKELKKCPFCGADVHTIEGLDLPELKSDNQTIDLEDTDSNLSDNYFEVEAKDKEEDESSDKYEVAKSPVVLDSDEKKEELVTEEKLSNTKEFDLSLEKTRSINPLTDTIDLKNMSLIDDINKQIDEINEEAIKINEEARLINESTNISKEDQESPVSKEEQKEEKKPEFQDLSSKESLEKRKKVLLFTGIASLILAIGILIFIIVGGTNKDTLKGDYLVVLEDSLNKYYETSEYEEIIKVLNAVKKDNDKIKKVQEKTNEYVTKWYKDYTDMDIKTLGDFEETHKKYKDLLSGLHINALITYDNRIIKAFSDDDYDAINEKLDKIDNDSSLYFTAMDYYNQNDYNRAYTAFNRIETSNAYYEKATDYKDKIVNNIMKLLEKDIMKIEEGLASLNDSEKLTRYTQIEQILIDYKKVYSAVNLEKESSYQMLKQEYSDLVSTYTEKISGKNESNSENKDNENTNIENKGENTEAPEGTAPTEGQHE